MTMVVGEREREKEVGHHKITLHNSKFFLPKAEAAQRSDQVLTVVEFS